MTRKRSCWLAVVVSMVMVPILLSGCGATQAPAATQVPMEQATQPAVSPTPTVAAAGPVQGGSITVAFQDDPNSLDAALGYNLPAWQSLMNLYRGLMIYEGDRAVPDMAADWPEISPAGLVYTFKIKPGIKFHNGREVEAADFAYSLNRVLDPELASWANYYLISIAGAQDVIDGKAEEAAGIEVPDKYTIRFTLTAPDMTFMNILALPNNWVVPKEEVERWGKDFGLHPVGTGPFMFKEYVPGEKVVFAKNPDFFHAGQPIIDETTLYLGVDPSTALLREEKGEVDVLFGDMIPTADFPRLMSDPKYKDWMYQESSMYTWWLGLNNKKPPLDNKLVRQALNLAINTEKVVKLTAGKGAPLYGLYPASCPGFDPSFRPYTYDPVAAKARLGEAGLGEGLQLELLIGDGTLEATLAQSIQQDLAQIGVTVDIKQVAGTVATDMITAGEAQMYLNDWYMIQPDAADLINNLYMTDAGSNQDFYSNPQVDELARQALGEQNRDKRLQLYRDMEKIIMEDAAHVPLYTGVSFYMHNSRIQGFYSRSEYGPFFERMWIQP